MSGYIKIFYNGNYSVDAVDFYLNLLADALSLKFGLPVKKVYDITDLTVNDYVIALDAKSHFKIHRYNINIKVFSWFQGILPEENKMSNPRFSIVNYLRIRWWEYLEKFSLNHSYCNIFVSQEMLDHYVKKYRYCSRKNDLIIPCFNKNIDLESFNDHRYKQAKFVYAGSLDSWQCFNETLDLFQEFQQYNNMAQLTILTKDIDRAKQVLKSRNLDDVTVEYVPYEEVDKKLQEFKYAFLLRKDHIVNKVATPTKMNTYLGNGLIPIFTESVGFYERVLKVKNCVLISNNFNSNLKENAKLLLDFDSKALSSTEVKYEFLSFFEQYYNRNKYIDYIIDSI